MWGLQSIAEEIYNLFWILNFCQPVRVSTDKWARVSWLLCCVPPLSGIFGIDPKDFLFPHKTFRKGWEAQFCPPGLVGCYVNVVSILSLSGIFGIDSPKKMGSTILPARVGWLLCHGQTMISKYGNMDDTSLNMLEFWLL